MGRLIEGNTTIERDYYTASSPKLVSEERVLSVVAAPPRPNEDIRLEDSPSSEEGIILGDDRLRDSVGHTLENTSRQKLSAAIIRSKTFLRTLTDPAQIAAMETILRCQELALEQILDLRNTVWSNEPLIEDLRYGKDAPMIRLKSNPLPNQNSSAA